MKANTCLLTVSSRSNGTRHAQCIFHSLTMVSTRTRSLYRACADNGTEYTTVMQTVTSEKMAAAMDIDEDAPGISGERSGKKRFEVRKVCPFVSLNIAYK